MTRFLLALHKGRLFTFAFVCVQYCSVLLAYSLTYSLTYLLTDYNFKTNTILLKKEGEIGNFRTRIVVGYFAGKIDLSFSITLNLYGRKKSSEQH